MLGIIGGTVFFKQKLFEQLREFPAHTKYGTVYLKKNEKLVFIPRHGKLSNIPPHKINHRANILALKSLGVKEVVGINSCGSLRKDLEPGKIVVPHDYINLFKPETFFDSRIEHIVPGISEAVRQKIFKATEKLGIDVWRQCVYLQTIGPRFESKAEVRMLCKFADIIGMTMASEATLCKEIGLEYASICSVDNFAHGLAEKEPKHEKIVEMASKNAETIWKIVEEMLGETQ